MGSFITFPELLVLIPLLSGIITFFLKGNSARNFALLSTIATLAVSIASLTYTADPASNAVSYVWMKYLGSSYYLALDGPSRILTFLTALSYPLIIAGTSGSNYKNSASFYGLLLLAMAGMMGVFVAKDALVFYFFWELALIPVYFLASQWGGPKRIPVTYKLFVYTFAGSLLMLIGIIYIYLHTPGRIIDGVASVHSFSQHAFAQADLRGNASTWVFWLFFIAFAIKMPVFPLHTWQPDAYDQTNYPTTMVLSGIMVKMGLFGVIRWLIPVMPAESLDFGNIISIISVIGIIYASFIALRQDNLRKLVAYSSIAHIGLISAALFSFSEMGHTGAYIQLFSHGINIIGMWLILYYVKTKTGTKQISRLGGLAKKAPSLTIFAVIIALANIGLPLTNGFVGEFMMFSGLWQKNVWLAVFAAIGIILAAIYTLNMLRNVFYGETNEVTENVSDINNVEKLVLAVIVAAIFIVGTYPQPLIELAKEQIGSGG